MRADWWFSMLVMTWSHCFSVKNSLACSVNVRTDDLSTGIFFPANFLARVTVTSEGAKPKSRS